MMFVPLAAVPSQTLSTLLGGQNAQITVFTLTTGLYFSLVFNDQPIVTTRICRNFALLINQNYSAFQGDFCFVDTQPSIPGGSDPIYTGLGARWQLLYLAPSDFAPGIAA